MLTLDIWRALSIALFMGLPGIPYAFWLLRKQGFSIGDRLIIGYTIGWVGIPLIFTIESLTGLLYDPAWIWVNWIAALCGGLILLYKEGKLSEDALKGVMTNFRAAINDPKSTLKDSASEIFLFLLIAAGVLIRISSSGGLLFELDPYFYLEGIKQVIYQGHNFFDDKTAWFPFTQSSHVGQPLFKYLLAPWFSLYNGSAPYSPYTLSAVTSIYAPLAGGLVIYFMYLFFREMYDKRAGMLAAGLAAFLPFFLIKFQGGDTQIVPYSIFALVFFLSMLYALIKKRSVELTALAGLAYAALVLGSNIEILIVFCLAVFLFGLALRHVLAPDDDSRQINKLVFMLFGIMLFVQIIVLFYPSFGNIKDWLMGLAQNLIAPLLAFSVPLIFDMAFERYYPKVPRYWRVIACIAALTVAAIAVLQLSVFSNLVYVYRYWGSYTAPLSKTIAEFAPGSPTYDNVFGFIAMPFDPAAGNLSGILNTINLIPTTIFNLVFNFAASVLNIILTPPGQSGNFPIIERANSMLTLIFFLGITALSISVLLPLIRKKYVPLYPILLLAFVIPMTFMGMEKSKLDTYLGLTLIFSVAASFGEIHDALNAKKDMRASMVAWLVVILLISFEFGWPFSPSSAWGAGILASSFTPTFQQSPEVADSLCQRYHAPELCAAVNNSAVLSNATLFYDSNLCARSIWPDPTQPPPQWAQISMSYRCSFLSQYWIASMEWIHQNVPSGERVISWWDYGHWINYFGQSYTVLRNEHLNLTMIGQTAYAYLDGDSDNLRKTMNAFHSRYALMDIEVIGSGNSRDDVAFGAKYSALNYLACAYANETDVKHDPGSSQCELTHLWENIVIPTQTQQCAISSNQTGYTAYEVVYTPSGSSLVAKYCATAGFLADGRQALFTYSLNSQDGAGNLQLHPAIWLPVGRNDQYVEFQAIYDHQKLWKDDTGQLIESYPYRTNAFYNSPLYQGFMLGSIDGFDLVYDSPQVKIFRMKDGYYTG